MICQLDLKYDKNCQFGEKTSLFRPKGQVDFVSIAFSYHGQLKMG
jgi:hypothetical protein